LFSFFWLDPSCNKIFFSSIFFFFSFKKKKGKKKIKKKKKKKKQNNNHPPPQKKKQQQQQTKKQTRPEGSLTTGNISALVAKIADVSVKNRCDSITILPPLCFSRKKGFKNTKQ